MVRIALAVISGALILAGCTSDGPTVISGIPEPSPSATSSPVTLDFGHCGVKNLQYNGIAWAINPMQQFRADSRKGLHYADSSGQVLQANRSFLIYHDDVANRQLVFTRADKIRPFPGDCQDLPHL